MVDAPVSGGVGGATAGTLTFMVGGPDAAFAKAKPILEKMGKNIVHTGASGAGQAVKICNNMMLAITMLGAAEGFLLGKRLGLDLDQDILQPQVRRLGFKHGFGDLTIQGGIPFAEHHADNAVLAAEFRILRIDLLKSKIGAGN